MDINSVFYSCKCTGNCQHITLETYKRRVKHEKIMAIVNYMQNYTTKPIYVYGGYLRNLINGEDENDVDVYFDQPHSLHKWRRHLLKIEKHLKLKYKVESGAHEHFAKLEKQLKLESVTYGLPLTYCMQECIDVQDPAEYAGLKIRINGILFDFHTQINGSMKFTDTCDYTCNNLYLDGNLLKARITADVPSIIHHIQRKQLIPVNSTINMAYRTEKMTKYGYRITGEK